MVNFTLSPWNHHYLLGGSVAKNLTLRLSVGFLVVGLLNNLREEYSSWGKRWGTGILSCRNDGPHSIGAEMEE